MTTDTETVRQSLKGRLCAITVGPYRVEYINDAGPYTSTESEHLAVLERKSVTDVIDIDSEYFDSLVTEYGADGVAEKY